MERKPTQYGRFATDHIYLQWIDFRLTKFHRVSGSVMKSVWIMLAVTASFALIMGIVTNIHIDPVRFDFIANQIPYWVWTVLGIFVGLIVLYPLVISLFVLPLVDLFIMFPTIVRSDIHRGFYSMLASVPVSSSEIAGDSRHWIIKTTLTHIFPGFLWLCMYYTVDPTNGLADFDINFVRVFRDIIGGWIPAIMIVIPGWFLLMNIVVLSTFRARVINTGCMFFLLVILQIVLLAVCVDKTANWSYMLYRQDLLTITISENSYNNRISFVPLIETTLISAVLLIPAFFYRWTQKYFIDWLRHDRIV